NRATAATRQAARVPAGGSQPSSGEERSRNGRSGATRPTLRVVAATVWPPSSRCRAVVAPISASPPTSRNMNGSPTAEASDHHLLGADCLRDGGRDLGRRQPVKVPQV